MTTTTTSPRMLEIRKLFLAVKFSRKDEVALDKRVRQTNIKKLDGSVIKDTLHGITVDEYKTHITTRLKTELQLNEANISNLLSLCDHLDSTNSEASSAVLEEINPHKELFGYVAAAMTRDDHLIDVVHIAVESNCQIKSTCCSCFVSDRQRKIKTDYMDALILNYLRIKVVEQLRIEGLTTRGQHHRKERFHPRRPSQMSKEDQENEDDDDDDDDEDDDDEDEETSREVKSTGSN